MQFCCLPGILKHSMKEIHYMHWMSSQNSHESLPLADTHACKILLSPQMEYTSSNIPSHYVLLTPASTYLAHGITSGLRAFFYLGATSFFFIL